MSSTPKCLQNPTLRLLKTRWGFVTLDRIAPQSYDVFMDGICLGRVTKFKRWFAGESAIAHPTRRDAIDGVIVSWYQRSKGATQSAAKAMLDILNDQNAGREYTISAVPSDHAAKETTQ